MLVVFEISKVKDLPFSPLNPYLRIKGPKYGHDEIEIYHWKNSAPITYYKILIV